MFNERLKEARNRKGLSQKQLAKLLHMSQQAVARWEIGTSSPDPDMLRQISLVLEVSADYLLGNTNIPKLDIDLYSASSALIQIEKILKDASISQTEKDDLFQKFTQIYFMSKPKE